MELAPADFVRRDGSFADAYLRYELHRLVQCKIQRFELRRLFQRQADQDAMPLGIDERPARRVVSPFNRLNGPRS
ncbi:hypothetical protein XH87_27500 [Bradyrhizobium sp. CCBAU 53415]|nr:hypothetical protein [Bradyrhizobium sp. CCBAU 53415]